MVPRTFRRPRKIGNALLPFLLALSSAWDLALKCQPTNVNNRTVLSQPPSILNAYECSEEDEASPQEPLSTQTPPPPKAPSQPSAPSASQEAPPGTTSPFEATSAVAEQADPAPHAGGCGNFGCLYIQVEKGANIEEVLWYILVLPALQVLGTLVCWPAVSRSGAWGHRRGGGGTWWTMRLRASLLLV